MSTTGPEYGVEWAAPARRALATLPEKVGTSAVEFVYGPLIEHPHRVGRPLRFELEGLHSAHRGDYRIVYRIDDDRRVVIVLKLVHRSDAYRRS